MSTEPPPVCPHCGETETIPESKCEFVCGTYWNIDYEIVRGEQCLERENAALREQLSVKLPDFDADGEGYFVCAKEATDCLAAETGRLRTALENIANESQNYQNRGDERDHATFTEVIRIANAALAQPPGDSAKMQASQEQPAGNGPESGGESGGPLECSRCGRTMSIPYGDEPTAYCHNCAQIIAGDSAALLNAAREAREAFSHILFGSGMESWLEVDGGPFTRIAATCRNAIVRLNAVLPDSPQPDTKLV